MQIILPAEWQNQDAIVLNFPHKNTDWQSNLSQVEAVFMQMAKIISAEQTLVLLFDNENLQKNTLAKFSAEQLRNIKSFVVESNDTWARDFFGISVYVNAKPKILDFTFNAWGNKFASDKDNAINKNLNSQQAFVADFESIDLVLEGGAIESDGAGTLMTSHFKNLHLKRNAHLTEEQMRLALQKYLGVDRILSLETGWLEGDDTDGHIDTLARFVDEKTIVYTSCNDSKDSHFDPLQTMFSELKKWTTKSGDKYNLIQIPIPSPIYNFQGERLAASYVNFIILKKSVILPIYGDADADAYAIDAMQRAMPEYKIHAVNAREIIEQGGSLHCLSMQIPQDFLN